MSLVDSNLPHSGDSFSDIAFNEVKAQMIPSGARCEVTRVIIPQLCETIALYSGGYIGTVFGSSGQGMTEDVTTIVRRFFMSLKQLIRGKKIAVIVTVRTSLVNSMLMQSIVNIADTVLGVESFAGRTSEIPAEFQVSRNDFHSCFFYHCYCYCVFGLFVRSKCTLIVTVYTVL